MPDDVCSTVNASSGIEYEYRKAEYEYDGDTMRCAILGVKLQAK